MLLFEESAQQQNTFITATGLIHSPLKVNNALTVTSAPTLHSWRSRVQGTPALRTPATIITHTCFPRPAHQPSFGLTWTQSPALFPSLYLSVPQLSVPHFRIIVCMSFCYPCSETVPVLFLICSSLNVWLPVPASRFQCRSSHLHSVILLWFVILRVLQIKYSVVLYF